VEAAAWLHDIDYAPALPSRACINSMAPGTCATPSAPMLCRLVAHHSRAIVEAGEHGLADVLSYEFEPAPYALSSVLTFCDMTTSPDGELVPVEQRLAEKYDRLRHRAPGEPVDPARHADDPRRGQAGP
jgi:hypothetical protein